MVLLELCKAAMLLTQSLIETCPIAYKLLGEVQDSQTQCHQLKLTSLINKESGLKSSDKDSILMHPKLIIQIT
jgi:hypothetical protein